MGEETRCWQEDRVKINKDELRVLVTNVFDGAISLVWADGTRKYL